MSTHSWTLDAAMREIAERDLGVIVLLNCGDTKEHLIDVFKAFDEEEKAAVLSAGRLISRRSASARRSCAMSGSTRCRCCRIPRKLGSMSGYGLEVTGFIPMPGGEAKSCPASHA